MCTSRRVGGKKALKSLVVPRDDALPPRDAGECNGEDVVKINSSHGSFSRRRSQSSTTESSLSVDAPDSSELKSCLKVKTQSDSLLLSEEKEKTSQKQKAGETVDKTRHKNDKRVEFSTLEVRLYPILLGDNPSISCGPPLGLDWYQDVEGSVMRADIESFESLRGPRRPEKALRIPAGVRVDWLHREGYATSEIHRATAAAMRCQRGRSASAAESDTMVHLKHGKEVVQRKVQRWIRHSPSDKILYNQWKEQYDTATCSAK